MSKIGFVGGGRMGEALIKGISRADLYSAEQIMAADPAEAQRQTLHKQYGIATFAEARDMVGECDIIILAVKPQIMGLVLDSLRDVVADKHLVISIAAGITLNFLESKLADNGCRFIRVMPNTPALIQEGATAISPGLRADDDDMAKALAIFEAVGQAVILPEIYLDAVTGLSGSGPAYVFSFIEGLIDAGVKVGLARDAAQTLVLQTVLGSVKLAMASNEHPAKLRAMVTSPGGTTIAGLHEMERAGFQGIIMDAVEAATNRSKELGKG
ncbi:MAG: pyrroline-5-carboxylate reductase [Deltaproteobacteria bacterium]|nr:pyrroline-5-carboxylate reductase [Deltaproteobacteria bacterium]